MNDIYVCEACGKLIDPDEDIYYDHMMLQGTRVEPEDDNMGSFQGNFLICNDCHTELAKQFIAFFKHA